MKTDKPNLEDESRQSASAKSILDSVENVLDEEDYFLQTLVSLVNAGIVTFGITLQMGGMLVSGKLIAGDQYFALFADSFAGGVKNSDVAPEVRASLRALGDRYREARQEDTTAPIEKVSFIHLQDCNFLTPGEKPTTFKALWRGRLAQVDGFFLGNVPAVVF